MGIVVKHLTPPTKSGSRTFRRRFPRHLHEITGWEHKVPLGKEASPDFLKRYAEAAADYDAIVQAAEKRLSGRFDLLDARLIAYLSDAYRAESLEDDHVDRWDQEHLSAFRSVDADLKQRGIESSSPFDGLHRQRWAIKRQETIRWALPRYLSLRAEGDLEGILEEWSDEVFILAEARGYLLNPRDEKLPELCRAINDAAISALEAAQERLQGKDVPTPPEPTPPTEENVLTAASVPLRATFDAYAASKGLSVGVRTEWQAVIKLLTEFLGHDDAAKLTAGDLRRWRDRLLSETTSKGTSRSPKTVKGKYLSAVRALLAWAVQEGRIETNVAAEVIVEVRPKPKLRDRDFTSDEITAILSATVRPVDGKLSSGHGLARRWVPWLCAYTGARVNEISQLRQEDVHQIENIWVVRITPEAGTVKTQEARVVPLHPHLIAQGFLEVVRAQGPGPLFYDTNQQRSSKEGNRHFKKVGERLAEWVRKEVGITDRDVQPNHAWRHTFKTLSADVGIEERVANAIQGHSAKTVAQSYGKISVRARAEAINKIPWFKVPGVPGS